MQMSDQLYTPDALLPGKYPPPPNSYWIRRWVILTASLDVESTVYSAEVV
jgi:hypothetical protein